MSEDMEDINDFKKVVDPIVERALNDLMEHADSVHIFISKFDPSTKNTIRKSEGRGNWYARYGQISYWVKEEDGYVNECGRQRCVEEQEEGDQS